MPTNGSAASRRAAELAFALADDDTPVTGLHIVTPTRIGGRTDLAQDVTAEMAQVGTRLERLTATEVREAEDIESGILTALSELGIDLLIMGTNVRAGTTRLHLGPRVEHVARHAPCPVLILNA